MLLSKLDLTRGLGSSSFFVKIIRLLRSLDSMLMQERRKGGKTQVHHAVYRGQLHQHCDAAHCLSDNQAVVVSGLDADAEEEEGWRDTRASCYVQRQTTQELC